MAKLSSAQRRRLATGEFAGPHGSYPIPDARHARAALARASEMRHKGRLSQSAFEKIERLAKRKLSSRGARSKSTRLGHR